VAVSLFSVITCFGWRRAVRPRLAVHAQPHRQYPASTLRWCGILTDGSHSVEMLFFVLARFHSKARTPLHQVPLLCHSHRRGRRFIIAASVSSGGRTMGNGAGLCAAHLREMAAHFRSLATIEPLTSLRRHLRRLAAQHDEAAANLEMAKGGAAIVQGETARSVADE